MIKVLQFGEIIGRATEDIKKGEWVHTHNVKSHLVLQNSKNTLKNGVVRKTEHFPVYTDPGKEGDKRSVFMVNYMLIISV